MGDPENCQRCGRLETEPKAGVGRLGNPYEFKPLGFPIPTHPAFDCPAYVAPESKGGA